MVNLFSLMSRRGSQLVVIASYLIVQSSLTHSAEVPSIIVNDQSDLIERTRVKLQNREPETRRESIEIKVDTTAKGKRDQLNNEFSQLFDELWKMNSNSVIIMTNLDVDQDKGIEQETRLAWMDGRLGETSTAQTNNIISSTTTTTSEPESPQDSSTKDPEPTTKPAIVNKTVEDSSSLKNTLTTQTSTYSPQTKNNHQQLTISAVSKHQPQSNFASYWKMWFMKIRIKIAYLLSILRSSFNVAKSQVSPSIRRGAHQSTEATVAAEARTKETTTESEEVSLKSLDKGLSDEQVRDMVKRQVRQEDVEIPTTVINITVGDSTKPPNMTESCIGLDLNKLDKCKTTELAVSMSLNNTFPGTLTAVEENCHRIRYLLSNCWPKHLQYISNLVTNSWNETLLATSDFPLPPFNNSQNGTPLEGGDGSQSSASCGIAPQVARPFIDRIDWMWLNLCMDRKFRLDYVENIKCLGAWGQERAQMTCSIEYKRMQEIFLKSLQAARKESMPPPVVEEGKVSSGFNSSKLSLINGTTVIEPRPQESSLDRDLESKIHCCVFDMFLRCVHRQSTRDCGKSGSQFVVNFLARIGTDDMKYLCRKELKSMNHGKQVGSRKSNSDNNDRHPFIESIYCSDPRIHNALYGTKSDDKVRFPGVSVNVTPRPTTARNNNRNSVSSATYSSSSSSKSRGSEYKLIYVLITWILIIIHRNIGWEFSI